MSERRTRVLMLCTGVGREVRGIETFFADAFAGLLEDSDLEIILGIGSGELAIRQETVTSLSRNSSIAKLTGKMVGRDPYTIEQMTSVPSAVCKIARLKPDVVFTSEANLLMQLARLRQFTGNSARFLYSNGAPLRGPFPWADFVHQVTPIYQSFALEDGDDAFRHFLVPYGFSLSCAPPDRSSTCRRAARRDLGISEEGQMILSVGWVARRHKRMDYVIDEVARLPEPRPLLAIIGAMDEASSSLLAEARAKLGVNGIVARSVPPAEVSTWYAAADVFVLGSLSEGFGRVYIEALGHGVPVFCHDYPVARFVNGPEAIYGDFSTPQGLASLLVRYEHVFHQNPEADHRRWRYARDTFGWPALASSYSAMFRAAAAGPQRERAVLRKQGISA